MIGFHDLSTRAVGAGSMLLLAAITLVIFSGVFRAPFEGGTRAVTVDFERAPQLHSGDQVRIDGNVDGKVTDVSPAPRGEEARVKLEVDDDAGPIYADARARLRAKTLLGGAFYVDLDRGTEAAGPLKDRVIGSDRTSVQVEVEDVTDIFRESAVKGLQTLPGQFATALSDPQPPGDAVRTLDTIAPDAATALTAARGRLPGRDIPDLIAATTATVSALDTPTDDLRTLVSGAGSTLAVTSRRSAEIQSMAAQGPAVTSDVTTTLGRLDRTLTVADGLISRLEEPAPDVAPTLAALRPTLTETDRLLDGAKPLTVTLRDTLPPLGNTGDNLAPLLASLRPSFQRVDKTILPYFNRKDPITGKPTSVMIGGTAAGFGGSSSQQDLNGHFIRFPASVGASAVYLPCSSNLIDPDANTALACDTTNDVLANYMKYIGELPGIGGAPAKAGK